MTPYNIKNRLWPPFPHIQTPRDRENWDENREIFITVPNDLKNIFFITPLSDLEIGNSRAEHRVYAMIVCRVYEAQNCFSTGQLMMAIECQLLRDSINNCC